MFFSKIHSSSAQSLFTLSNRDSAHSQTAFKNTDPPPTANRHASTHFFYIRNILDPDRALCFLRFDGLYVKMFLKSFLTKCVCNIYFHKKLLKLTLHNYFLKCQNKMKSIYVNKGTNSIKGHFQTYFSEFVFENVSQVSDDSPICFLRFWAKQPFVSYSCVS